MSHVDEAMHLLAQLRAAGFIAAHVSVGPSGVTLDGVADLRIEAGKDTTRTRAEPTNEISLQQQFGGELYAELQTLQQQPATAQPNAPQPIVMPEAFVRRGA